MAHATEIARRQLIVRLGSNSQSLREELASFTLSTKKAVLSLNTEDLQDYILRSKTAIASGLQVVIQLLVAYTPESLQHLRITEGLQNWQQSLTERASPKEEVTSASFETVEPNNEQPAETPADLLDRLDQEDREIQQHQASSTDPQQAGSADSQQKDEESGGIYSESGAESTVLTD